MRELLKCNVNVFLSLVLVHVYVAYVHESRQEGKPLAHLWIYIHIYASIRYCVVYIDFICDLCMLSIASALFAETK